MKAIYQFYVNNTTVQYFEHKCSILRVISYNFNYYNLMIIIIFLINKKMTAC